MTMFSCSLLVVDPIADLQTLENSALPNARHVSLAGLPYRFGPSEVSVWARKRAIDIYYVDNCWVRVPVTPEELRIFLHDMGATCSELTTFSEPDFRQSLIIDADEF
ncbi:MULTISPECIES: hypothetical protein [unclassified Brevundimonas]|uniref:hypothetical protein n=1 Tax=unclassified Brevundimonas TaxID=2622653 RepID=UPI0006F21A5E|nr:MULTISPECIES: hypothetical protein [unclassified Brevundimonas]KQY95052.1 hypothetical protein ASD25_17185 [Brevundimonas sp. Root1423]KRA28539.1 hypothetical protein ASD59_01525 [Brevundimonas sp. Root608]